VGRTLPSSLMTWHISFLGFLGSGIVNLTFNLLKLSSLWETCYVRPVTKSELSVSSVSLYRLVSELKLRTDGTCRWRSMVWLCILEIWPPAAFLSSVIVHFCLSILQPCMFNLLTPKPVLTTQATLCVSYGCSRPRHSCQRGSHGIDRQMGTKLRVHNDVL